MGKVTVLGKDEWITPAQVMRLLGKSERSVLRLATAGHLRWKLEGGKRVYHAGDVVKVKEEGIQTQRSEPQTALAPLRRALVEQLQLPARQTAPRPWLMLEEAVESSGLCAAFLLRQVKEGKIKGIRGGPHGQLRILRASLETFAG
jgi:hypothetical protein